jgi:hypothetical protein
MIFMDHSLIATFYMIERMGYSFYNITQKLRLQQGSHVGDPPNKTLQRSPTSRRDHIRQFLFKCLKGRECAQRRKIVDPTARYSAVPSYLGLKGQQQLHIITVNDTTRRHPLTLAHAICCGSPSLSTGLR